MLNLHYRVRTRILDELCLLSQLPNLFLELKQEVLASALRPSAPVIALRILRAALCSSGFYVSASLLWVGFKTLPYTQAYHVEPYPFAFLDTLITVEAVLLASFILMRLARMGKRADERDYLMLQVLLLTERELTTVLRMDREIARCLVPAFVGAYFSEQEKEALWARF